MIEPAPRLKTPPPPAPNGRVRGPEAVAEPELIVTEAELVAVVEAFREKIEGRG
ncbi:hypothetical protein [Phenylobacterium zucineum]|uniref:hypothetical protein n=1 Tax=Phenylobacterium zucineum TaxID=284016 RepID=UPI0002D2D976|nr:hypothetical protein [Phenylobacterium zucineum]